MCGIIAGVSSCEIANIALDMLKTLEYRGYDSSGIAYFENNSLTSQKCVGGVDELKEKCSDNIKTNVVIGHTRWATHGKVSLSNAQPIVEYPIALVHNGIFENYKEMIAHAQVSEASDTFCWTQILAKKLRISKSKSIHEVLRVVRDLLEVSKGVWAICFLHALYPNTIFFAKKESPLVLGIGDDSAWLSSDEYALSLTCKKIYRIEDGQIGWVSNTKLQVYDKFCKECDIFWKDICSYSSTIPTPNESMMSVEIKQGIDSAIDTLDRFDYNQVNSFFRSFAPNTHFYLVGCGTAYNAGLIGKFWLKERLSFVEAECASEFLINHHNLDKNSVCIFISQSGETADTLNCVNLAKANQITTLGVINMENSSMAKLVDLLVVGRAGKEYAVAATKSYMAQLSALYALSNSMTKESNYRKVDRLKELLGSLKSISQDNLDSVVELIKDKKSIYLLGRGLDYLVALEGALKLKEVTYIHVEAIPAGELKHGSIALIDENFVSIVLATQNDTKEKIKTSIAEIKCRGGKVVVISPFKDVGNLGDIWIRVVECEDSLAPFVLSYPLQRLAYLTAISKGINPDKPRNLAKSVTVE